MNESILSVFNPLIECFDPFEVPFSINNMQFAGEASGMTSGQVIAQCTACCACSACSACSACG